MSKLTQKNIHKLGRSSIAAQSEWPACERGYKWYVRFPAALTDELEAYWKESPPADERWAAGGADHHHLLYKSREDAREFVRGFNRTQREIESKKEEVKVHPVFQKVLDLFGSNFQK